MPLMTEDGQAISVDEAQLEFARAMAAPEPDEPAQKAPPRIDHDAPPPPRRRGRPPAAEKPRTRAKTAPPATDHRTPDKAASDRVEAVSGLMQIIGGGCLVVAQRNNDEKLLADAVVIGEAGRPMGEACASVAATNPKFAAALDKLTSAGPYAALLTVAVGLGSQLAANHDVLPGGAMGTRKRSDILATLETPPEAQAA
jgi:hypothetical protein